MKNKNVFSKIIATILTTIMLIGVCSGAFILTRLNNYIKNKPELNVNTLKTFESPTFYDAKGNAFAELGGTFTDNVKYEDLPNAVIDAFISVEDARFFSHNGFDGARFLMTIIDSIPNLLRGSFGAGASTITMQTIKNSFFVSDNKLADRSVQRKIQEIVLSLELEKLMSKQKIIEFYLNKINFGASTTRGIAKAAEYYFGKSIKELNISEAAYLAGVINLPGVYNAYKNIEAATTRRNEVLALMLRHGYISSNEYKVYSNIPLESQLNKNPNYSLRQYQKYIDTVANELEEVYNINPMTSGLKVYTSLIPSQQKLIEDIESNKFDTYKDSEIDSAFITINNQTGEIVAVGGGRKYEGQEVVERGFINATQIYRQPGSVLKPIFPYALGFEVLGYSTKHTLQDTPYAYKGSEAFLHNYNRKFQGDIELEQAIVSSLNIPAVRAADELVDTIGQTKIVEYLNNLGFNQVASNRQTLSKEMLKNHYNYFNVAYAIGASTFDVTPLQVAGAHATIINRGQYIKPHTITRIEIPGQEPIIANYAKTQVISEGAAFMATQTMKAAVEATSNGTTVTSVKKDYPVYGKSGTSDYGDDFVKIGIPDGTTKDTWIAASTNKYTVVSWFGYKKNYVNNKAYYIKDTIGVSRNQAKLVGKLLDETTNYATPELIKAPSDVEQITQVRGLNAKQNDGTYRYITPFAGLPDYLITNSWIKKEFANTVDFNQATINTNSGSDATIAVNNQNVSISKDALSGNSILIVSLDGLSDNNINSGISGGSTYIASATNSKGKTVTATVNRIFDFGLSSSGSSGGILTVVKANGMVIDQQISYVKNRTFSIPSYYDNTTLEVCSYPTNHPEGLCNIISNHNAVGVR